MKKILVFLVAFSSCSGLFAQTTSNANEMKNFRFGGTVLPSLDWYTPNDLKKFGKDGTVAKFGVLINGEYNFSGNFAFGFGIGIASSGGKMTFSDTAKYYYNDNAIIKPSDTAGLKGKYFSYQLNTRKYNASYFLIPLSLKMRTNEIGYMRYFFQPGITIGIRKKVLANDNLNDLTNPANIQRGVPQTNLNISDDMSAIRLSATISAGAEYYVSGSTALVFSIGYDYGLTNVAKSSSDYLIRTDNSAVKQNFTQSGVIISAGVLF